jgi:hypothetical protein
MLSLVWTPVEKDSLMKLDSEQTALAVSNATALTVGVLKVVMGKDVASTLAGTELGQGALANLITSEIEKRFLQTKLAQAQVAPAGAVGQ